MGRGLARDLEARSGGKLGRQYQADYIFNIYYKDRVNFSVVLILNAFPFKRFNFQFIVNNCKVVFLSENSQRNRELVENASEIQNLFRQLHQCAHFLQQTTEPLNQGKYLFVVHHFHF